MVVQSLDIKNHIVASRSLVYVYLLNVKIHRVQRCLNWHIYSAKRTRTGR